MKAQHTLGPWIAYREDDKFDSSETIMRIIDPTSLDHPQGPVTIATINVYAHAPHLDEPDSNMRLIAAAPELLAALENAANVLAGIATGDLKTIGKDSPALVQARAAIAKARGEA